jgi:diguanylate cyclase (GGDEF)-like protein/PAS domain S-box-containing protein
MEKRYDVDMLRSGLIDEMPLVIVGIGEKGDILYWNRQAEDVLGVTLENAVKLGLQTVLPVFGNKDRPTPDVNEAQNVLREIFSGKRSIDGKETTLLSSSGSVQHVKWSGYVSREAGKKHGKVLILSGLDQTDLFALREVMSEKARYMQDAARRVKLYSKTDPATGLFNYRHLISELSRNFYYAAENSGALSLAIMNVDYFYSVNSAYGTAKGTRVLRELAALIKKHVKEDFIVSRFSGGEIAILMPGTDIKTAFKFARGVFSAVTDHNFLSGKSNSRINLSVRMALGGYPHCEDANTPDQLIGRVLDKLSEARATAASTVLICPPSSHLSPNILPDDLMRGEYPYTVEFVNALARAVKSKDHYTQEHSSVMSEYAVSIAEHMGLNKSMKRNICLGSILHDVGKIGIDKTILLKPDALNEEEREVIKQHPRIGAEIIRNVHPLKGVVPIVLHHHERFDGGGYLEGLKGDSIPLGARIVSLADVFQALTSDRPYRKALEQNQALSIIEEYSGSFFDPSVVKAFFEVYSSRC